MKYINSKGSQDKQKWKCNSYKTIIYASTGLLTFLMSCGHSLQPKRPTAAAATGSGARTGCTG